MGLELKGRKIIFLILFAVSQLLTVQYYEDMEFMARKLIERYGILGLKLSLKIIKHMGNGDIPRNL